MMNLDRSYSELITFETFEERYRYLRLDGVVGEQTFGFDRFINQYLYQRSQRWKEVRRKVIMRDNGCDLGVEGYDIGGRIIIHHMNVLTMEDILDERDWIFDPEYLISTSHNTHNAIHYGNEDLLVKGPITRQANDTCPWRK